MTPRELAEDLYGTLTLLEVFCEQINSFFLPHLQYLTFAFIGEINNFHPVYFPPVQLPRS
mgnify:CR=1 FL=1